MPKRSSENRKYSVGLTFPSMKLQVREGIQLVFSKHLLYVLFFLIVDFQVFGLNQPQFGPSWWCGEMLGIGLWVGIIITLFLAAICWAGFAMLASIETNDRYVARLTEAEI